MLIFYNSKIPNFVIDNLASYFGKKSLAAQVAASATGCFLHVDTGNVKGPIFFVSKGYYIC